MIERMPEAVTGRLAGRRAIVTGAGQGVGRGIALALAAEGAAVALLGRTKSKLTAVAAEIAEGAGARAVALACDVKDSAQIERAVEAVVAELGGLDILVNNAQETPLGTVLNVTDEALIAGFESGPLAAFRFMKACHPYLGGGGVIINLGSGTSVNPQPIGRGVYGAVKATTAALGRAAATEWGVDGIRVVTILPAATSPSADTFARDHPEAWTRSMESIPLRRLGRPVEEIGRTVVFLCSDDACYITGTTIAIDGGQAYLR